MINIFDFKNYKDFLKERLERGLKTKLAEFLGCHIGFISQVIHQNANFSMEHGLKICEFLKLTEKETEYFVLLIQEERAGSVQLKKYFKSQIQKIHSQREEVSERVDKNRELTNEDKLQYFADSNTAIVHMILTLNEQYDAEKVSEILGININAVNKIVEFLVEKQLIEFNKGRFNSGRTRIHLDKSSPLLNLFHTNTRVNVIKLLSQTVESDLHYSGYFTMTPQTAKKIKEILLNSVEECDQLITDSKDEKLYILAMDMTEIC